MSIALGETNKWQNKTNGITPRRWLMLCNPSLTAEITEKIGNGWHLDLTELRKLEQFVSDASFVRNIAQIKQENKERFASWVERTHGLKLNTSAMFDIHVKRIHEYKVNNFN